METNFNEKEKKKALRLGFGDENTLDYSDVIKRSWALQKKHPPFFFLLAPFG
jgi:hypothetical protein